MGIVGVKAGHYQTEQEKVSAKKYSDLYIDLGCCSAAEVATLGVRIGDPIAFVSPIVQLAGNPHLIAGKVIDNRLGCAVLLNLLRTGASPSAGSFIAAFTVQEEVGLKGAKVAAERWRPDLALALDTMPAGDTPDMSYVKDLNISIGAGPAIQVMAGAAGRSNIIHPVVRDLLCQVAEDNQVPIQLCAFSGGSNDSASMAWAADGIPSGSITIPRRYAHSPVEVADLRDAKAAERLISGLLGRMDRLPAFTFLPAR